MSDPNNVGTGDAQSAYAKLAALFDFLLEQYDEVLLKDPAFAQSVANLSNVAEQQFEESLREQQDPPDSGISSLIGLGGDAVDDLGKLPPPKLLPGFDETVVSERLLALADLYYIYQQERLGVFRVVLKLQELFKAGELRLADGRGAYALYKFDQQSSLRSSRAERFAAYCRSFGYGCAQAAAGAGDKRNAAFHGLLVHFITEVASYFRDTRISELFRERQQVSLKEKSFGSIATVRRAGLNLRSNLKEASYGQVNVLRLEGMQLLRQAYTILEADDIRREFAAESGWDTLEQVGRRYLGEKLQAASRSRLAVTGRSILIWLAQPHILLNGRAQFDTALLKIGESAEEWLTTAQTLSQEQEVQTGRPAAARPQPGNVVAFRGGGRPA